MGPFSRYLYMCTFIIHSSLQLQHKVERLSNRDCANTKVNTLICLKYPNLIDVSE